MLWEVLKVKKVFLFYPLKYQNTAPPLHGKFHHFKLILFQPFLIIIKNILIMECIKVS